jgi:hypothetical protein
MRKLIEVEGIEQKVKVADIKGGARPGTLQELRRAMSSNSS